MDILYIRKNCGISRERAGSENTVLSGKPVAQPKLFYELRTREQFLYARAYRARNRIQRVPPHPRGKPRAVPLQPQAGGRGGFLPAPPRRYIAARREIFAEYYPRSVRGVRLRLYRADAAAYGARPQPPALRLYTLL